MAQAKYALHLAIYLYQSSSHPRADTSARWHNEHGKDSISHESVIGQKTKADDPSSVLHFSNSDRDSPALAVSLAL
jgi:hypothetical protein